MDFYYKCKRRIVKTLNFVLVLIIAVSGHLLASNGYDVKVIDGDSLEIGNRRIRLLDIDAPEYKLVRVGTNQYIYADIETNDRAIVFW